MNDGKAPEPAATPDRPQDTNKLADFQERFNAHLEKWRAEGCGADVINEDGSAVARCGAKPHRTKLLPKDANDDVTMQVDCQDGHENVWQFKVPAVELQAELARQAAAAKQAEEQGGAAKDPLKASVTIIMDLRTQEVRIEPWVPTPGMGIQLAGILMSHFFAQMQAGAASPAPGKLKLPAKGLVHPKTGKPLVS